jgi:hypothetical protein
MASGLVNEMAVLLITLEPLLTLGAPIDVDADVPDVLGLVHADVNAVVDW